jgi:hypothetical protein
MNEVLEYYDEFAHYFGFSATTSRLQLVQLLLPASMLRGLRLLCLSSFLFDFFAAGLCRFLSNEKYGFIDYRI